MKLMFTLQDDYSNLRRIITANFKYIRWYDEPLRVTEMYRINLPKVPKGTVMPKYWMR